MRTWHRSTIACTTSPVRSSIRSRASRLGATAYASGTTSRTLMRRSVIAGSPRHLGCRAAAGPDGGEEVVDQSTCLLAAVEAPPGAAQVPHELIAGVDRHDVAVGAAAPRAPPHEESLDAGGEQTQLRVRPDDRLPCLQRQLGLRRSRRPRVE